MHRGSTYYNLLVWWLVQFIRMIGSPYNPHEHAISVQVAIIIMTAKLSVELLISISGVAWDCGREG